MKRLRTGARLGLDLLARGLPRSLVGRVFALYSVTLLVFVGAGLGLFYRFQFSAELEAAQTRAEALAMVIQPTVSDSAVIGDDDTIARTLERAIFHSSFASAAFIDLKGRKVQALRSDPPELKPPAWLTRLVQAQLFDTNLPINVGGRDYGVLRLSFAPELIAGELWRPARAALLLGALALVGGLVLIRFPLVHWLGHLGRLRSLEEDLRTGGAARHDKRDDDAPIEFRQTFAVLNQAAESLQAQREQAAVTLGAIGDAVLTLDPTGAVLLANPAAGALFGQPVSALLRQPAQRLLEATLSPMLGPAGSGAVAPLPAAASDIEAISLLISGLVTRLQERGEQLSAIFALSPDGFVSFDAQRRVSYVNPAFVRLTGLDDLAVLGLAEARFDQRLAALCSDAAAAAWPGFERLRQDGQGPDPDSRRALLDIERPARRVLQVGLRQSQSPAISQVFYLRDVTHETAVDQMKSEFLSTAAHELRTPMASIFGFCELLLHRTMPPERQREMLTVVHRQTQRMVTILNELLDLARIEARRGTDFRLETVDLAQLTREVVAEFQPPEGRKRPQVPPLPSGVLVRIDRNKLHQALGNVLSNAYKYSPGGGPVALALQADTPGAAGEAQLWGIRVQDQGIGMTAEQLGRVSERFYRADASGTIPGTGLGMSIVKEIVELLGGRLQLQSEAGQGSCVTLWLPAAPVRPAVARAEGAGMGAGAGAGAGAGGEAAASQWGPFDLTAST